MKLLTVPQPRASLLAAGRIVFDTRPEQTDYRGPVAIHAASALRTELGLSCFEEPMKGVLQALGLSLATLPRGSVIATAELVDVVQVVYGREGNVLPAAIQEAAFKEIGLGQWQPGIFAYRFENVRPLGPIDGVRGTAGLRDVAPWLAGMIREAREPAAQG